MDEIYKQLREKLLATNKLYNKSGTINSNLRKLLSDNDNSNILLLYPTLEYSAAVYCIISDIRNTPCCIECNKPVKSFYGSRLGFSQFCSLQCSRKNSLSKNKRIETNLRKYGVKNPKQSLVIQQNSRDKTLQKYGVTNTSQLPAVKEKISSTLKSVHKAGSNDILEKKNKTFELKYGMHPNSTTEVKTAKIKNTYEKYGVEHTTQLLSTKVKATATIFDRYGVDHYSKTDSAKQALTARNKALSDASTDKFVTNLGSADTTLLTRTEIADLTGFPFSTACAKLRVLGFDAKTLYCSSSIEKDVAEFIQSLGVLNIVSNSRSIIDGKELDIFLPDYNLAIEIDGVYWHTEQFGKDKDYHLSKTLACELAGIQLLHIFDSEWTDPVKQQIWKSMIVSRLRMNTKIYARKCIVKDVELKESQLFCDNNHLQGYRGGTVRRGLYFNGELVQIVILGASRYNKQYAYELIRSATIQGYTIVGGLSKLLSTVSESIISYADRRYSNGIGYKSIGMVELKSSPPNYFYNNNGILESRLKYQKHKLPMLLETFDESKSESYNMLLNGFYRIWDCGNLVFTKTQQP